MLEVKPINVDRAATPKDYKHLANNELLVTKIFSTIQGEGPFTGWPAVFVRLAGCNYGGKDVVSAGCSYCDSAFEIHNGKAMSFEDIATEINTQLEQTTNKSLRDQLIVITGGEPLLQKNLNGFIQYLEEKYPQINTQIESNGVFPPNIPDNTVLVVSPKAVVGAYHRLREDVFLRASCLKFLISADENSGYFDIPEWAIEFISARRRPVYVSPINIYARSLNEGEVPNIFTPGLINIEATMKNYKRAALVAMQRGLILNTQTHLFYGLE